MSWLIHGYENAIQGIVSEVELRFYLSYFSGRSWFWMFQIQLYSLIRLSRNQPQRTFQNVAYHCDTISRNIKFDNTSGRVLMTWTYINSFIFPSNSCLFHLFRSAMLTLLIFKWNTSTTKASSGLLILLFDLRFFVNSKSNWVFDPRISNRINAINIILDDKSYFQKNWVEFINFSSI